MKLNDFNLIIFGANGDLSYRKIFPALYHRLRENQINANSRIIAILRNEKNISNFKKSVESSLKEFISEYSTKVGEQIQEMIHVIHFDLNDAKTYGNLSNAISKKLEIKIFYLATPANVFGSISRKLNELNLIDKQTRIVLEKPIGHNKATSDQINKEVLENFNESQIYRIDHYLGKETVQNLMVLRFANYLFENSWNANHIKNIQITAAEKIGVEKRGDFYNKYGALLDMVQNHLLQLLCLIAMEPPTSLSPEEVRTEKHKVLKSLKLFNEHNIKDAFVKGQYSRGSHNGTKISSYLEDINKFDSKTETFVAIRTYVNNWRWKGVPFYIRTGKRMSDKFTEIIITFKNVPHNVFLSKKPIVPNKLIIRLQPKEKIEFIQMIKVPGPGGYRYKPVKMELDYQESVNERFPEAYERLLMDVVRGNQTLFMSFNELCAAWEWIESIIESYKKSSGEISFYSAGTDGPGDKVMIDNDEWDKH